MPSRLPPELAELKLGSKVIQCDFTHALVLSERTQARTHVTSQRNLKGQVMSVGSYTTTERSCWVRYATGREAELPLPDIAVRAGQMLAIVYVDGAVLRMPSKQVRFMAYANHATRKWKHIDLALTVRQLSGMEDTKVLWVMLVIATMGFALIPLYFVVTGHEARYAKPLAKHLGLIADWALSQPVPDTANFLPEPAPTGQ